MTIYTPNTPADEVKTLVSTTEREQTPSGASVDDLDLHFPQPPPRCVCPSGV